MTKTQALPSARSGSRFAAFTWGVLVYNILVILFGAYVRASGSGAGCGAHWPLCNGVVLPRPERVETIIEFTHRITSGLVLVFAVVLLVWVWRKFPKGSLLRWSSSLVMFFTVTEALVGASLVLYGWVADNDSVARAISMMVHLVNTFLLLSCIVVTAWWASDGPPKHLKFHGIYGVLLLVGFAAILLLGASGAVTALGDTLFPSGSLAEGIRDDFSPTAHYLVRMRVLHPTIAVSVGIYLALVTLWIRRKLSEPRLEMVTNALFVLFVLQLVLGVVNVALLAPVWIQIVHLLMSNLVWIAFILMATIVFSSSQTAPRLSHQEIHHRIRQISE